MASARASMVLCGLALGLFTCANRPVANSSMPLAGPRGLASSDAPPGSLAPLAPTKSVLQFHANPSRDGLYVDPSFTLAAIAKTGQTKILNNSIDGNVYAQPLYIEKGVNGADVIVVVTETNNVYALNAESGQALWHRTLAAPVSTDDLDCGNINPLGITGTPVVDASSGSLFFDAMQTPDGGTTKHHVVYGLSLATGANLAGWPVDVAAEVAKSGQSFKAEYQNQRGALIQVGDKIYVPYGGHFGDCGEYHGWIVGISISDPKQIRTWITGAREGGIWAPGGISSSGQNLFVATGNTDGATAWAGGEAIVKLPASTLAFQADNKNYFTPENWLQLDAADLDLGGVCPILLHSPQGGDRDLALGFGKDGNAYLVDQNNLGGIGGALGVKKVGSLVITAPAAVSTASGSFVFAPTRGAICPTGTDGDLVGMQINNNLSMNTAWCATQNGTGSPIVTTTDGHSQAIVWSLGAEGDGLLHAFIAETGKPIFAQGQEPKMPGVQRFVSPIVAKSRIYAVGNGQLYSYQIDN